MNSTTKASPMNSHYISHLPKSEHYLYIHYTNPIKRQVMLLFIIKFEGRIILGSKLNNIL